MRFGTDIHGAQTMNANDFGDPMTFHVAPPACKSFHLFSKISLQSID